jgi:cathepsin L
VLESHFAIQHGQLYKLSEQELVDCSGGYGNQGCNGGWYDAAFNFAKDYGMMQAGHYPYVGYQQGCYYNQQLVAVRNNRFYHVAQDPNALKQALNNGPVSVAVECNNDAFRYYRGGILTGGCGTRLDHAIVAVGWGSEGGRDYFIVRNSWGAGWGEGGYIRIAANGGAGVCGILSGPPSFPVTQ